MGDFMKRVLMFVITIVVFITILFSESVAYTSGDENPCVPPCCIPTKHGPSYSCKLKAYTCTFHCIMHCWESCNNGMDFCDFYEDCGVINNPLGMVCVFLYWTPALGDFICAGQQRGDLDQQQCISQFLYKCQEDLNFPPDNAYIDCEWEGR